MTEGEFTAMPGQFINGRWVDLICTDNGRHHEKTLIRVWLEDGGGMSLGPELIHVPKWMDCISLPGVERASWVDLMTSPTWELRCPVRRCTRRPRIRRQQLEAESRESDGRVDVSKLNV